MPTILYLYYNSGGVSEFIAMGTNRRDIERRLAEYVRRTGRTGKYVVVRAGWKTIIENGKKREKLVYGKIASYNVELRGNTVILNSNYG